MSIRFQKPPEIFTAAFGQKKNDETEKCCATRYIQENLFGMQAFVGTSFISYSVMI